MKKRGRQYLGHEWNPSTPLPKKAALEETPAIVKDSEAALCLEVTYEPPLEAGNGDRTIGNSCEFEAGVLSVEILVEPDLDATSGVVVGQLGREVGITEK